MVSYHYNFLRKSYCLIDLSYQRYLGQYVVPLFFQVGAKAITYDGYNPCDHIYDSTTKKIDGMFNKT